MQQDATRQRSKKRRNTARQPFPLPIVLTLLLCIATGCLISFDLIPAIRDHRRAEAALTKQIARRAEIIEERDALSRELDSLLHDPQAVERELDDKGLLPVKHSER